MKRYLLFIVNFLILVVLACLFIIQTDLDKNRQPNISLGSTETIIKVPPVNSFSFTADKKKDPDPGKNTGILPDDIDKDWYSAAIENIKKQEYEISYQPSVSAYQSPNRTHNLRFTYMKDGFSAQQRAGSTVQSDMNILPENVDYKEPEDWMITMKISGYGKGSADKIFSGKELIVNSNKAYTEDESFKIEYENTEAGMRQNFIVKQKPDGDGLLKVAIKIDTKLEVLTGPEGLTFNDSSNNGKMSYNDLKVFDAAGKKLSAGFEKGSGSEILIAVNDADAVYPVLIDPLSAAANWNAESNQADARFGCSVATAGDVNGDSYSDVIVGADYYDGGMYNEGKAYLFYGSSSGLSATPNWTSESNQTNACFGRKVSTAGDVNGDGYSDIIVSATFYDNGETDEGRAFIFHGSASGLSANPDWTAESNQADADFGISISTAGDVNGDGYSDVIVGADYYDNGEVNEGRTYLYFGSSSGLSATPNWTAESNQINGYFGCSVFTAGDVNGDGYSDVIVGADYYDNGQGNEGRAYLFHGSSSGLSATPNWTSESNQADAQFGNSVSTAGDINGDGYSDVIVGSSGYDNGETDEGRAFVFHGSSSGLSATPNWTSESDQSGANFGNCVSTAGDVNSDGYSDVIVGAIYFDNGQSNEGRVYVFHGSSSGLSSSSNWTAESDQGEAYFGSSVSTAGDINGDGYSDVIVSANQYDNGQTNEGRAYVYNGSPSGLSATSNWTAESNQAGALYGNSLSTAGDVNGDGYSDVIIGDYLFDSGSSDEGKVFVFHGSSAGLSATPNWTAESNQGSARFGCSVSTAGDVNGDGYSDVIIGSLYYDNGESDEGRAFVYYGSSSGLSASPGWTAEPNTAGVNFGCSVSTAGDVNGDGYSDVLIGEYNYDNVETNEGCAFVYHGSSSGLSAAASWSVESNQASASFGLSVSTAGDVNGDGFSDVIVGSYLYDNVESNEGRAFVYHGSSSGLSTVPDWTAESDQTSAYFGSSVSAAGDVNGDGYSDVIVGSYRYNNVESDEGRAYVYYGSSSGLSAASNWTAEPNQAGEYFGYSVSTAGDVNGDGYSDVIAGSYSYDNGESNEGRAYVYYGSSSGLSAVPDWTAESNQADAAFGNTVSAAGDINGDGYSDIIIGSPYYDNGEIDEGKVFIYYGNGSDGMDLKPRQYRTNLTTPVIAPLKTRSSSQAGLGLTGKTFFGRSKIKVQFEVKQLRSAFNGSGLTETGSWTDIGTAGTQMNQLINGLATKGLYKWRARIKYQLSGGAPQSYSRWFYPNANGRLGGADFQVADDDAPLPVELTGFTASAADNGIELKWTTAAEVDNYGFEVEKSVGSRQETAGNKSNLKWEKIGFVEGAGNSNSPKQYSFVDANPIAGNVQYRLKQINTNGSFVYFNQIAEVNYLTGVNEKQLPAEFALDQNYPNPFNPLTKIQYAVGNGSVGKPKSSEQLVTLKVYDILGNEVAELVNEHKAPGYYEVEFDAGNLATGVYIYRLTAGSFTAAKKLMLMK